MRISFYNKQGFFLLFNWKRRVHVWLIWLELFDSADFCFQILIWWMIGTPCEFCVCRLLFLGHMVSALISLISLMIWLVFLRFGSPFTLVVEIPRKRKLVLCIVWGRRKKGKENWWSFPLVSYLQMVIGKQFGIDS